MMDGQKTKVCVNVSSDSVQESNYILRRLYEEISKAGPIGWQFMPERRGNDIFVGYTNWGELYLHYKKKGCIDKICFFNIDEKNAPIIENAINIANQDHNTFSAYSVRVEFNTGDVLFREMAKNQIYFCSERNEDGNNRLSISFNVEAFGDYDIQYIANQKINYLKILLSAYTNILFDYPKIEIARGSQEYPDINWSDYDEDWIDDFLGPDGKEAATLLPDFFAFLRLTIDNDYYNEDMKLILNAAQDYYCSLLMRKRLLYDISDNIPGIVDTINTMLISTLEPLSCINKDKPEICPVCGNKVYKISAHIRALCENYLGEYIAKDIADKGYSYRSSFLHEGHARTNEFFSGRFYPQIDPVSQNEMLWVVPLLETNTFDFVSYVFRKVVHDWLIELDSSSNKNNII